MSLLYGRQYLVTSENKTGTNWKRWKEVLFCSIQENGIFPVTHMGPVVALSIQAEAGRNPDREKVWGWVGHRTVSQPKRSSPFNCTIQPSRGLPTAFFKCNQRKATIKLSCVSLSTQGAHGIFTAQTPCQRTSFTKKQKVTVDPTGH